MYQQIILISMNLHNSILPTTVAFRIKTPQFSFLEFRVCFPFVMWMLPIIWQRKSIDKEWMKFTTSGCKISPGGREQAFPSVLFCL